MRALWTGFVIVTGTKGLRRYVWGPVLLGLLVLVVVWTLALLIVPGLVAGSLAALPIPGGVLLGGAGLLTAVVMVFLSGAIFMTATSLIGAQMFEKLTARVEEKLLGTVPTHAHPPARIGLEIGMRIGFAFFVLFLVVILGWLGFGVVGLLLLGFLAVADATAPSFARRGVLFPRQIGRALRLPGALPFLVGAGALAAFPLVNVLAYPVIVAGGACLVAQAEQKKGVPTG